jgi:hypothetical protein
MTITSVTPKRTTKTRTAQVCVIVPLALRRKVQAMAKAEGRSFSNAAALLIESGLKSRRGEAA